MKVGVDYIGVSVGAIIINDENKILLCKRSKHARNEKGKWEAPGGGVNFGETRENAIKRELREELGVAIQIIEILHISDEILTSEKQHWIPTTYVCKIRRGQNARIMEPTKCDEIGWFSLNKLPKPLSYITELDLKAYKRKNSHK